MLTTTAMFDADTSTNNSSSAGNFSYDPCEYHRKSLSFNSVQLTRVCLTWMLFFMSASGNLFVLYCVLTRNRKSHVHVITTHLVLANLVFTLFSMPMDAIWNVTMAWKGGGIMCKICQMLKQFGMYVSSLMVVMIAADRAMSILAPMANASTQRRRIRCLLIFTWIISFLFAIPAAVFFDVRSKVFCDGEEPFHQCIDFAWIEKRKLQPYYIYTMCFSFVIPFITTAFSYSLVLCEINSMQLRDIQIVGKRASKSSNIAKARKKTFILMSMVSLAFVLFWGPYYGIGITTWFNEEVMENVPPEVLVWLYLLLYLNPAVHPFIYGAFMRDVRNRFFTIINKLFCVRINCKLSQKNKLSPSGSRNRQRHRNQQGCVSCCRRGGDDMESNDPHHLLMNYSCGGSGNQSSSTSTNNNNMITTRTEHITEYSIADDITTIDHMSRSVRASIDDRETRFPVDEIIESRF